MIASRQNPAYHGAMSSHPSPLRLCVAFGVLVAASVTAGSAWSRPGGITGYSGKTGGTCNSCHQGGLAPTVELTGPTTLDAGVLGTYTFKVTTANKATGMNAAVSDGTMGLVDGGVPVLQVDEGEVTHTNPTTVVGGSTSYTFTMTAPEYGGPITLYAAGNAVDLSGDEDGDQAAAAKLEITVNGPPKPAEPDSGTPPPQPTATATATTTATTPKPAADAGGAGQDAGFKPTGAAPDSGDDSGCSIGWADRSSVPTGVMFGSIVALAAFARARRRPRASQR